VLARLLPPQTDTHTQTCARTLVLYAPARAPQHTLTPTPPPPHCMTPPAGPVDHHQRHVHAAGVLRDAWLLPHGHREGVPGLGTQLRRGALSPSRRAHPHVLLRRCALLPRKLRRGSVIPPRRACTKAAPPVPTLTSLACSSFFRFPSPVPANIYVGELANKGDDMEFTLASAGSAMKGTAPMPPLRLL